VVASHSPSSDTSSSTKSQETDLVAVKLQTSLVRQNAIPRSYWIPETVGLQTLDPFKTQLESDLPSSQMLLHHCKLVLLILSYYARSFRLTSFS